MNDDIKNYIVQWNLRFPYDRRWRKKYNMAFGCSDHRESSFFDQVVDIEEDNLFKLLSEKVEFIPNSGDWISLNVKDSFEEEIKDFEQQFGEDG